MRIGLFADIHGNAEAFDACLAAAREAGVEQFVFLGDIVGYGPDPARALDRVAELVQAGGVVVQGNHDEAVAAGPRAMTSTARQAVDWTREQLGSAQREFLGALPLTHAEDDRLYVHASAREPAAWTYVHDRADADKSLAATEAFVTFCGHTHVPALFHALAGRRASHFRPLPGKAVPLSKLRRHVVVLGAVGQPRDRNPRACWGLYDTAERTVTMRREPYDIEATVRKINAAGLPEWLGERLFHGR